MGFNEDLKLAQEINELLNPVQLGGIPKQQYLGRLVQFDAGLRTDPAGTIEQIARLYNYDLSSHGQQEGFKDPLQARIDELEAKLNQQTQNAQQTELQRAEKLIEDFAKDKPDFYTLEPIITRKIQTNPGMDLQSAYEAVKGELNLQTPPTEEKPEVTSQQRVPIKQKKKAASGVKSTNNTVQPKEPQTIRDELANLIDKAFPDGNIRL
jgi:DNA-binding transcriptional MerR regulator